MGSRPVKRFRCVSGSDGGEYGLETAVKAHEIIAAIDKTKLYSAGEITLIPYLGIGRAPSRPGGNIQFIGRSHLQALVGAGTKAKTILVVGGYGVGKSCLLRALACGWFIDRVVCIWNLESGILERDLVGCVKNALKFTFCKQAEALDHIAGLTSMEDIAKFLRHRVAAGDKFFFVVDQMELLDVVTSVGAKELLEQFRKDLFGLFSQAAVTALGISLRAGVTTDYFLQRYDTSEVLVLDGGFAEKELCAFRDKLSVLGPLCSRFPERTKLVEHYTGSHPFSLAVLDNSCRRYALNKRVAPMDMKSSWLQQRGPLKVMDAAEVIECLQDEEDWQAAIDAFLSSGEIERIRSTLAYALSILKPQHPCHSIQEMARLDARFIVGDDQVGFEFVTKYIGQVYTEEFRAAEKASVFRGGAWEPYCRYLLEQRKINWGEMGWVCENLVGEVIQSKGITLAGMTIDNVRRLHRFSTIPTPKSWEDFVTSPCSGVLFLPLKYNYGSIDGLIIWRDAQGGLHFIALQVTVNEKQHQHSASELMNLASITRWIPDIRAEQDKWKLHFVFLCCRDGKEEQVPQNLTTIRNVVFGGLEYTKRIVSFTTAFKDLVDLGVVATLEMIARKRDDAVAAPRAATVASATSTVSPGSPSNPDALKETLKLMRKDQLETALKQHKVETRGRFKDDLVNELATLLCDL